MPATHVLFDDQPFAALFADEMRRRGYAHCQYFGCDRSMSLAYEYKGCGGVHQHAMFKHGDRWLAESRAQEVRRPF